VRGGLVALGCIEPLEHSGLRADRIDAQDAGWVECLLREQGLRGICLQHDLGKSLALLLRGVYRFDRDRGLDLVGIL
jgi:hypothetical protein